jgi:hypothetical protein
MAGWMPHCPSALWSPGAPQTPRWCIRPPHPRPSLCSRRALCSPCWWPRWSVAQKLAGPAWPAGWQRSRGSRGSRPLAARACGAARPRFRSLGCSARPAWPGQWQSQPVNFQSCTLKCYKTALSKIFLTIDARFRSSSVWPCGVFHSIQPLAERPRMAVAAVLGLANRWSRVKI